MCDRQDHCEDEMLTQNHVSEEERLHSEHAREEEQLHDEFVREEENLHRAHEKIEEEIHHAHLEEEAVLHREHEHEEAAEGHHREIHYTVNDEPQETRQHKMTAYEILDKASPVTGYSAAESYLKDITVMHHEKSYKDNPDEIVHLRDDMKFLAIFNGGTTVS